MRIGAHKSAPEAVHARRRRPTWRRPTTSTCCASTTTSFSSRRRRRTQASARTSSQATFAKGPFVANEAQRSAPRRRRRVRRRAGAAWSPRWWDDRCRCATSRARRRRLSASAPHNGIALIYVDGDMVDGKSRDIPLLGTHLVGSYTIAKALKDAREDPQHRRGGAAHREPRAALRWRRT